MGFRAGYVMNQPILIRFDGSSKNNGRPNQEAAAAAILYLDHEERYETSQYLNSKTNNQADFAALVLALEEALALKLTHVQIEGDSKLVIEALTGTNKIKHPDLIPYFNQAQILLGRFDSYSLKHIPRTLNEEAHSLCQKTISLKSNQKTEVVSPEFPHPIAENTIPTCQCLAIAKLDGTVDQEAATALELHLNDIPPFQLTSYLGSIGLQEAELVSVRMGLQAAQDRGVTNLHLQTSSQWAVDAIQGTIALKSPHLITHLTKIQFLATQFESLTIEYPLKPISNNLYQTCSQTIDQKTGIHLTLISPQPESEVNIDNHSEVDPSLLPTEVLIYAEPFNRSTQLEQYVVLIKMVDPSTQQGQSRSLITKGKSPLEAISSVAVEHLIKLREQGLTKIKLQTNQALFKQVLQDPNTTFTGPTGHFINFLKSIDCQVAAQPIPERVQRELHTDCRQIYESWVENLLIHSNLEFQKPISNNLTETHFPVTHQPKLNRIDQKLTIPVYSVEQNQFVEDLEMQNTLLQGLFPNPKLEQVEFGTKPEIVLNTLHNLEVDICTGAAKRGAVLFSDMRFSRRFWECPEDAVAYGSNLMTECSHLFEGPMRIMVVRDKTYETGDCHAKLSLEMARDLNTENRGIQYRLGFLNPNPKYQTDGVLVKGTAVPHPLCQQKGVDMIIPESAFKSSQKVVLNDKEIERIIEIPRAVFGLFQVAELRQSAVSYTVLQYFSPEAIANDVLPFMNERIMQLQEFARWNEPYLGAKAREKLTLGKALPVNSGSGEIVTGNSPNQEEDSNLTRLFDRINQITAYDSEGLLKNLPNIQRSYQESLARQWRSTALGGGLRWPSGMALPTTDLKDQEIYCPELPQGEYLMIRYPLRNQFDIIVVTNKRLTDPIKQLSGCIWMNETTAGLLGGDTDGDFFSLADTARFPSLAREVKDREASRYEIAIEKNKRKSPWSRERIKDLLELFGQNHIGRLTSLGIAAHAQKREDVSKIISYEMQRAVMMFKHNVSPDNEWLDRTEKEIRKLAWQRGNTQNGQKREHYKDPQTYIDYPILPDPLLDTISRMIHFTNRKWNQIRLHPKHQPNQKAFQPFQKKEFISNQARRELYQVFRQFNQTSRKRSYHQDFQKGYRSTTNYFSEINKAIQNVVELELFARTEFLRPFLQRQLTQDETGILREFCTEKIAYGMMHHQTISKSSSEASYGTYLYKELLKKINRREKDFFIKGTLPQSDALNKVIHPLFHQAHKTISNHIAQSKETQKPEPEILISIQIESQANQTPAQEPSYRAFLVQGSGANKTTIDLGVIQDFSKPESYGKVPIPDGTYLCQLQQSRSGYKIKGFIDSSKLKIIQNLETTQNIASGTYSVYIEPAWVLGQKHYIVYESNPTETGLKPMGTLSPNSSIQLFEKGNYEIAVNVDSETKSAQVICYRDPLDALRLCPNQSQKLENDLKTGLPAPNPESNQIILNHLASTNIDSQILEIIKRNQNLTTVRTPVTNTTEGTVQGYTHNLLLKTYNPITNTMNGVTTVIGIYETRKTGIKVSTNYQISQDFSKFNSGAYFHVSSGLRKASSKTRSMPLPDKIYVFNQIDELFAAATLKKDERVYFVFLPFKEPKADQKMQPSASIPLDLQEWLRKYQLPLVVAFQNTPGLNKLASELKENLRREAPEILVQREAPLSTWKQTLKSLGSLSQTTGAPSHQPGSIESLREQPASIPDRLRLDKFVETQYGLEILNILRRRLNGPNPEKQTLKLVKTNQEIHFAPVFGRKFIPVLGDPAQASQIYLFGDTLEAFSFSKDLFHTVISKTSSQHALAVVSAEYSPVTLDQLYSLFTQEGVSKRVCLVESQTTDPLIVRTLKVCHPDVPIEKETTLRAQYRLPLVTIQPTVELNPKPELHQIEPTAMRKVR